MMSNTSNVAAGPITTSSNLNTGAPAGLVSSHPLTTTGLPLTSAPHLGLTNVNNDNTFTHTGIAPLAGADAMIAPVASHITLPAPVLAPGQAPALLHGGSTTTLGQTATPMMTAGSMESHHHATPMMTTGAPLATAAPITQSLPMQTQPLMTGAALPQTTTTHTTTTGMQPTMITTTTDSHHGHHDASHTDKELMKEREKESHRLAKEQEKLAKERAKEQKKHDKEEEKMLKKQEKEHLKHEKEVEKEHLKHEKELEKEHKKQEKELAKEHRHDHHTTTTTQPGMMAAPIQSAVLPAGAVVLPTYAGSGLPVAAGQGYANPLLTDAQAAAVEIAKVNQLNTYQQPIAGTTTVGTGMHAAPITAAPITTTTTTTTTQPSAMHTAPRY